MGLLQNSLADLHRVVMLYDPCMCSFVGYLSHGVRLVFRFSSRLNFARFD